MPCVNSFLNYKLATGARVAALYSILLSCSMLGIGLWHLQPKSYYKYNYKTDRTPEYIFEHGSHVSAMGYSYLGSSILLLLSSISLLVGVYKKNHHYSWPWLIVIGIAIIYFTLCAIVFGFHQQALSIAEQIFLFLGIFIMTMFYIVVISYKQHSRKRCTTQVAITTNQQEVMQPHQYLTDEPTYAAYPSNSPIDVPTPSNLVQSVHFPPPFYPPPIQSKPRIKPPNPAFYPQPSSEYGLYPSLTYPVPFTPPNPQSAPNNSSIPPQAPYNPSIPPLQFLQQPYGPENAPAFPEPSAPH